MDRIKQILWTLPVVLLVLTRPVRAEEARLEGHISYISAEMVFVTLGSGEGLSVGDTLSVFRKEREVGRLVVDHVSDRNSSTRPVVGGLDRLKVNDVVVARIGIPHAEHDLAVELSKKPGRALHDRTGDRLLSRVPSTHASLTFRGYVLADGSSAGHSWARPSMLVAVAGNRLGAVDVQHSFLVRLDRNFGSVYGVPGGSVRVYHAWLGVVSSLPLHPSLRIGRLNAPLVGGVGLVDGLQVSARVTRGLETGVIYGKTPALTLEGFHNEGRKTAVLLVGRSGRYGAVLYQGGAAYVREALDAGLDREWLVHESHLNVGRYISAGLGLEMDLAAADSAAPGGTFQLSNAWTSIRLRVSRDVSVGLRAKAIKFVKRLQTYRSIPDSLWDDAQRLGVFTDVRIRMGAASWSFGGGVNNKAQTSMMMLSAFARVDHRSPPIGNRAGVGVRLIRNLFLDAAGIDSYLEKDVSQNLTTRLNLGTWVYGYGDAEVTWKVRPRLEGEVLWSPGRAWFLFASLGCEADPDTPAASGFVEVTRRF